MTDGTKKTAPPTWDFFLEFGHRLQKEAATAMARKKIPLVDALALARADESLYNRQVLGHQRCAHRQQGSAREREDIRVRLGEEGVCTHEHNCSTCCGTEESVPASGLSRCTQSKVSATTEEEETTFGTSSLSYFVKGSKYLQQLTFERNGKNVCCTFQKGPNACKRPDCSFLRVCANCGSGMDACRRWEAVSVTRCTPGVYEMWSSN